MALGLRLLGQHTCSSPASVVALTHAPASVSQVRTKTLVKSAVVQIDAAPFRTWYMQHYGKKIGVKTRNGEKVESDDITDVKRSNTLAVGRCRLTLC